MLYTLQHSIIPVDDHPGLLPAASTIRIAEHALGIMQHDGDDDEKEQSLLNQCLQLVRAPMEPCSFEQVLGFAEDQVALGVVSQAF